MERPESMKGIPVGIPYSDYADYYDQIVACEDAWAYVVFHKLNDALTACYDLLQDCRMAS